MEDELALLFLHLNLILIFRILRVEVRDLVVSGHYPGVAPEVSRRAHFLYLIALHLVLGEALLHAPADEGLAVLGQSVENLHQGEGLLVGLVGGAGDILDGTDQAASGLHVRDLLQVLLVDHL